LNIVVLSGKGGTGKTLVSTNLAVYMGANYIDTDVEEPNGFIFLKSVVEETAYVEIDIPDIDKQKCVMCFKCVDFCEFNALAKTKQGVLVFDKLCHSCGGCKIVCPVDAVNYKKKNIGIIEKGKANHIKCIRGVLNIGEPIAVPIIKEILNNLDDTLNMIDASPGTSCNVVKTLEYADAAILVTEPTKFGLHDLGRAVKLVEDLNIPFGVVINRITEENNIIKDYCKENKIHILAEIKHDKNVAVLYSKGELLLEDDRYKEIFESLSNKVKENLLCK